MFKRITSMAVVLAMLLTFSVGCSQSDVNQPTQSTAQTSKSVTQTSQSEEKQIKNFNKTGFPIVNEKITLKAFCGRLAFNGSTEFNDIWIMQEMEKKTNIHLEWDTPDNINAAERLNVLIATDDMPDFIIRNGGAITTSRQVLLGSEGTLISLNKLIDNYAPNLQAVFKKRPDVKNAITVPDGNIYVLPSILDDVSSNIFRYPLVNKKWMEKLGLSDPKTWDEFLNMLRAFRDKDPNGNGEKDEVAFDVHNMTMLQIATNGFFGIHNTDSIVDGKYSLMLYQDAYKEQLKAIKLLYNEKLIDTEIFTSTDAKYFSRLSSNKVGFTSLFSPTNAGKFANDFFAIEPPSGPSGIKMWSARESGIRRDSFYITKANKYPEATVRWADFFYGDEGATMAALGPVGITVDIAPDGSYKFKPEILGSPSGFSNVMGSKYSINPGRGFVGYYTPKQTRPESVGSNFLTFFEKVEKYVIPAKIDLPLLDSKDSTRVTQISNDLKTYTDDMRAQFILGRVDIDAGWAAYVAQCEKIGIKELEKIYQTTIDKINSAK